MMTLVIMWVIENWASSVVNYSVCDLLGHRLREKLSVTTVACVAGKVCIPCQ